METIIAIDPGSAKCGVAVLSGDGCLHEKKIVKTEELPAVCVELLQMYSISAIVVGNGTRSGETCKRLCGLIGDTIKIKLVDEKYTTEMGRKRYWRYHPPRGWKRWLPTSWQVPPVPVDDFVAWIIGEKYFGKEMPEVLEYLNKNDK